MCTSITFETDDKIKFLARTMDFSFPLHAEPIFIPREHKFDSHVESTSFDTKYAFIGAGRDMGGYLFADGVNEKGFGIATLYFESNAVYSSRKSAKKLNIAPDEMVSWALGNVSSVNEFEKKLVDINIMNAKNGILKQVLPLHWIVSDYTGNTKVLEITSSGVNLYDNPVGVMTNSPTFPWHLTNLSHYSSLQPSEYKPKKYGTYTPASDGPGNGLMGLPGDYTAASRFVRASVLRQYSSRVEGEYAGLNSVMHILNSVDIPKGVKITNTKDETSDFTQYKSAIDLTNKTYYMLPYSGNIPRKISLTDKLIEKNEPVVFPILPDKKLMEIFDHLSDLVPGNIDWATALQVLSMKK